MPNSPEVGFEEVIQDYGLDFTFLQLEKLKREVLSILYPCSMVDFLFDSPHLICAINWPLVVSLKQILAERTTAFIVTLISGVGKFVIF
jgi:hypothetical protein